MVINFLQKTQTHRQHKDRQEQKKQTEPDLERYIIVWEKLCQTVRATSSKRVGGGKDNNNITIRTCSL